MTRVMVLHGSRSRRPSNRLASEVHPRFYERKKKKKPSCEFLGRDNLDIMWDNFFAGVNAPLFALLLCTHVFIKVKKKHLVSCEVLGTDYY